MGVMGVRFGFWIVGVGGDGARFSGKHGFSGKYGMIPASRAQARGELQHEGYS